MAEVDIFNSAVLGVAAFLVSFIVLYILWSIVIRVFQALFSRSKLYFIPRLMKELGRSIFFLILLVSIYLGVFFYDASLIEGTPVKILGVLLILTLAEIASRILLGTIDVYRQKLKGAPTFLSNRIPLLKRIVGLIIYATAALLVVSYLSYEVGTVIALFGVVFLIFMFVVYYSQVLNILAGLQLPDRIQNGDYICTDGISGFVEDIYDQYTVLRKMDGHTVSVPNSRLLSGGYLQNLSVPEGNLITLEVVTEEFPKSKEKLTEVCGKVALESKEIYDDYSPKVFLSEVRGGKNTYIVKFILVRNGDLRSNVDKMVSAIRKEFKNKLTAVGLV